MAEIETRLYTVHTVLQCIVLGSLWSRLGCPRGRFAVSVMSTTPWLTTCVIFSDADALRAHATSLLRDSSSSRKKGRKHMVRSLSMEIEQQNLFGKVVKNVEREGERPRRDDARMLTTLPWTWGNPLVILEAHYLIAIFTLNSTSNTNWILKLYYARYVIRYYVRLILRSHSNDHVLKENMNYNT